MTDMVFLEKLAVHTVITFMLIYVSSGRGTLCPLNEQKLDHLNFYLNILVSNNDAITGFSQSLSNKYFC